MDKNHLNWVKSHDWGKGAILKNETILFVHEGILVKFKSIQTLRKWAGY